MSNDERPPNVGRMLVRLGLITLATAVVIGGLCVATYYALDGRPGTWLAKLIGYVYVGTSVLIAAIVIPLGIKMSRRPPVPPARVVRQ